MAQSIHPSKTRVIVFNGPSSAGKTTLARACQNQFVEPYLHFEMDAAWRMLPTDPEKSKPTLFPNISQGVIDSIVAYAKSGHNMVVDLVFMPKGMERLKEALSALDNVDAHYVLVLANKKDLETRENVRENRKNGTSLSQYEEIQKFEGYTMRINTSTDYPQALVKKIQRQLDTRKKRSSRNSKPSVQ